MNRAETAVGSVVPIRRRDGFCDESRDGSVTVAVTVVLRQTPGQGVRTQQIQSSETMTVKTGHKIRESRHKQQLPAETNPIML